MEREFDVSNDPWESIPLVIAFRSGDAGWGVGGHLSGINNDGDAEKICCGLAADK
jgi:hypothetical protein